MKFTELQINEKLKKGLTSIGFDEMMPIQEQTIPIILEGTNMIGEADTGTGKTASFVIPILNNIDFKSNQVECLIITPTRELAMQIVTEIEKIGKYLNPTYATLVGGMSIRDQVRDLNRKPAIVVGTLGRINDHLRNKKLDLSHVKCFVLDEADEMLKEGFKEDITAINNELPVTKQSLLFSATISKQILTLSKAIMDDYQFISVKDKEKPSQNIDQFYMIMKENQKFATLTKLLDVDTPKSAIIFGRTKRRADELNEALNKCGYKSACIHGDLSQQQRNSVMKKFRENEITILVATDVAARGLDINDISHVYNFDLPQEVEFYIHRIGRTGRANKYGVSYSFIKDTEMDHIRRIEKETNITITEKKIPTSEEVMQARSKEIKEIIKNRLKDIDVTTTKELALELMDEIKPEKLISVLIESLSRKMDINQVSLTGEPPVKVRRQSSSRKEGSSRSGGRGYNRNRSSDGRGSGSGYRSASSNGSRSTSGDRRGRDNRSSSNDGRSRENRAPRSEHFDRSKKNYRSK